MYKVGFDISQIAHFGGVATYTQNLASMISADPDLDVVFFYSSLRQKYEGNLKNVKSFKIPPTLIEPLFNKLRIFPIENFIGKIDIFHSSDWTQPKSNAKKVTTYHDVIPLKYPDWSTPKIVEVHQRRLKIVEEEIDQVIAVSQSTKCDLLELSKISESRITVIYEGPSFDRVKIDQEKTDKFKQKYNLPKDYVLAIGGVGKRRNLERVKKASQDFNLVISGETIPWVEKEELPLLYAGAKVLLYPSFYEGFGIPILDAFQAGVPVITSSVSSMPEVGGDGALYVGPEDLEDIEKKLKKLMGDDSLRKEMIEEGYKQVSKFSWEKCAKETVKVYKNLVK